ncbi:hypothetical protein B0H34DRAFT_795036 [Crassisporium funariophilum]|nr:hypothetical protein B0H34DRAFT_795036 [Crassisporium funariophilum]
MALRRFAHENHALASPRSPEAGTGSSANAPPPSTPRPRLSYSIHRSPADTPSISSSVPFDWEAARSRAPPPYSTPIKARGRKSVGTGTPNGIGTPRKAVVRKKGFIERMQNIPSAIAFEIALFPQNVPLPTPKTSARILGEAYTSFIFVSMPVMNQTAAGTACLHETVAIHGLIGSTTPITLLLVSFSIVNTYNLYTRTKNYQFHGRTDPLASPNAKFVLTKVDHEPIEIPSIGKRIRTNVWYAFSVSWRFLLGFKQPSRGPATKEKTHRVQELDMWTPSDLDLELFSIYSPAHALLWLAMGSTNWIVSILVMGLMGIQLNALSHSYTTLLKDRQLLASETMKEYNDVFVYPRINPIRRDVAVMTHQSEVVNVWEQ